MLVQLSLTYDKTKISRDILTNFLTENESALAFLPVKTILPSHTLLTLIQTDKVYKLGNLNWGHSMTYKTGTILYSDIKHNKTLNNHFKIHRCLILANQFVIKSNKNKEELIFKNDADTENVFYLAGLFIKQIINHKTHYFALVITQDYLGQEFPVILNDDQLKFYLNPKTIIDELTFLFHQHAYQNLFKK